MVYYEREDAKGPKQSNVILFPSDPKSSLKEILEKSLGVLTVVDKEREIYFIDNIKFHLDKVKGLGTFIEIEARDTDGSVGVEKLRKQCNLYLDLFEIQQGDLLVESYSDLLFNR